MELAGGTLMGARPVRLERPIQQSRKALWIGYDERRHEDVVVKMLQPERIEGDVLRQRFEREGNIASMVSSPHVAKVLDRGITESGMPYLVFERLVGETMAQRLSRRPPLGLPEVGEIIRQAAEGLAAAHEVGVVHRDVEPSNLFLAETEEGMTVKILDFGIARMDAVETTKLTMPGQLIGTPPYVSPERVKARPAAASDDLWALAVVAYQALTQRVPFDGDTFGATYVAIVAGTYTPATVLRPELPPAIDTFFEQAFAREPARRFKNAIAMARALCDSLAVEPAFDEAPPSSRPRSRRDEPVPQPPLRALPRWPWLVLTHLLAILLGVLLAL